MNNFSASFDAGLVDVNTNSDKTHTSKHEVNLGEIVSFWLDQNEKDKTLKLTQFVDDDAVLNISSTADEKIILLSAPLINMKNGRTTHTSRVFNFQNDGRNFTMRFDPIPVAVDKKIGSCTMLDTAMIINQKTALDVAPHVGKAALYAGVLVRVSKSGDWFDASADEISLKIQGSGGWITADNLSTEKMPEFTIGELSMLQFRGNIADLLIDNISTTPRALSTYQAFGSLNADFGNQGRIKVYGLANGFWKDKERLNQTKWEKLDWEPKLFVFGIFGALLSLLWPLVIKRLSTDREFDWMQ